MLKTKLLYSALSGLLLFLAFPPFNFFYLAFIALVPLIIVLDDAELKEVILISFVFTTVYTFGILTWIYIYNAVALPGMLIYMNFFYLIVFLLYYFISRRLYIIEIYVFPIVWVSIEYLRSANKYGFPWGVVGYSQSSFIPFIQISDIISVFGISLLICYFNSIIAFLILTKFKSNRILIQTVIVVIIFFIVFLYGFDKIEQYNNETDVRKLKVAVVQSNFSPYTMLWNKNRNEIINHIINSVKNLSFNQPDIIILSESVILDDLFNFNSKMENFVWKNFQWKYYFSKYLYNSKSNIFFGTLTYRYLPDGDVQYFNSVFLLNNFGDILGSYDKIHLVPFGEFMPFSNIPAIKKMGEFFQCGNFSEGSKISLLETQTLKIAPLICYESIFHSLARNFAKLNPDVFINITNDAWTESSQAHYQHFLMNVFTSIQNRIPLIRCGNSGISGYINEVGVISNQSIPFTKINYSFSIEFKPNFRGSFFARYGDLCPKIILILFGLLFLISFFFPKKNEYV